MNSWRRQITVVPFLALILAAPAASPYPIWIEQGPAPNVVNSSGLDNQTGAVHAIAPHPNDPNTLYIATVSGGVWMTTDALAPSPAWYPLTDHLRSLRMSAIVFSRLDFETLYAAFGSKSHGGPLHWWYDGQRGGPPIGMIKTTTGGRTWFDIPTAGFASAAVEKILPTGIGTVDKEIVLVATSAGIYRSPDGGMSWVGVLTNDASDLVQDPSNPQRLYAGCSLGVERSDDAGLTWTLMRAASRCTWDLAISPTADASGNHLLYAGCVESFSLQMSRDGGATWATLPQFPDGSAFVGELAGVPQSPEYVMALSAKHNRVAPPSGTSCAGVCDRTTLTECPCGGHWILEGESWTRVDGPNAGGTFPHGDGRDWVFSADPNVTFEADDGGIYRLTNPVSGPRSWSSANGNLGVTEFVQLSYDNVNHLLFGGAWDLAIPHQTSRGDRRWMVNEDWWGDGVNAGGDNCSARCVPTLACCESTHYSSQQKMFHFTRNRYLQGGRPNGSESVSPKIEGIGYNVFEGNIDDSNDNELGGFTRRSGAPWRVNVADGQRLILGTGYLYESFDRADNFRSLGGVGAHPRTGAPVPMNPVGEVQALAYGHVQNPDVLYVGTSGKTWVPNPAQVGTTSQVTAARLWVRTGGTGAPIPQTRYTGDVPYDIAMSPGDWRVAYLVDASGRVWQTTNAGADWRDISGVPGNGSIRNVARSLQVITVVPIGGEEFVFVGGLDRSCDPPVGPLVLAGHSLGRIPRNQICGGGVFVSSARAPLWSNYGDGLPNALVTTLGYDRIDDVLFAGTYGRGAWTIPDISTQFPTPGPVEAVIGKPSCHVFHTILSRATPISLRTADAVTSFSYAVYPDDATPLFSNLSPAFATFTLRRPPGDYNIEYFASNGTDAGVHRQFSVRLVEQANLLGECALEQWQRRLQESIKKIFRDHPVPPSPVRLVQRAQKRVERAIIDASIGRLARSEARIQSALRSHLRFQSKLDGPKYQVIAASSRSLLSGMNLNITYQLASAAAGECTTCQSIPPPSCGDGICAGGDETCSNCSSDCGSCSPCVCDETTREECERCAVGCACCRICACGNGVCGEEEDCEVCPADCGKCQLRVFVTFGAFSGAEIGGLAGADAICAGEAQAEGLPGTYKAWLSDSQMSAAERLSHGDGPYVMVDGTKVADDWDDLTDGSIDAPIVRSASGTDVGLGGAWTATDPSGGISYGSNTCSDWTSNSGLGADGYRGAANGDWTLNSVQPLDYCSVRSPLYCVEQREAFPDDTTTTTTSTTTTTTMMPCGGSPPTCQGACPPGLVCLSSVCRCGTP